MTSKILINESILGVLQLRFLPKNLSALNESITMKIIFGFKKHHEIKLIFSF